MPSTRGSTRASQTPSTWTCKPSTRTGVKGAGFYSLDPLCDELAGAVEKHVDIIADRAPALGGFARGTARIAAAASSLLEFLEEAVDGRACVEALAER